MSSASTATTTPATASFPSTTATSISDQSDQPQDINEPPPSAPDSLIRHDASIGYWNTQPATVDGMLGDYPTVSRTDLRGSLNFLSKVCRRPYSMSEAAPSTLTTRSRTRAQAQDPSNGAANLSKAPATYEDQPAMPLFDRAADCGGGVGRITAGMLSKVCKHIDIVEPVAKFAAQARNVDIPATHVGRLGSVLEMGLQDWTPTQPYDLFWNQWCLGHLTDAQLEAYLLRSQKMLNPGGWIVVKENISTNVDGNDIFDEDDSSVTRTDAKFRDIFARARLKVIRSELQAGMPKVLYPVRSYALQPIA